MCYKNGNFDIVVVVFESGVKHIKYKNVGVPRN